VFPYQIVKIIDVSLDLVDGIYYFIFLP